MSQVAADGVTYKKTYNTPMLITMTGAPTFEFDFGNGFVVVDLTGASTYPNVEFSRSVGSYKFTLNGGTAFTSPVY